MVPSFSISESLKMLVKVSDSTDLARGLRICVSIMFPGGAVASLDILKTSKGRNGSCQKVEV